MKSVEMYIVRSAMNTDDNKIIQKHSHSPLVQTQKTQKLYQSQTNIFFLRCPTVIIRSGGGWTWSSWVAAVCLELWSEPEALERRWCTSAWRFQMLPSQKERNQIFWEAKHTSHAPLGHQEQRLRALEHEMMLHDPVTSIKKPPIHSNTVFEWSSGPQHRFLLCQVAHVLLHQEFCVYREHKFEEVKSRSPFTSGSDLIQDQTCTQITKNLVLHQFLQFFNIQVSHSQLSLNLQLNQYFVWCCKRKRVSSKRFWVESFHKKPRSCSLSAQSTVVGPCWTWIGSEPESWPNL